MRLLALTQKRHGIPLWSEITATSSPICTPWHGLTGSEGIFYRLQNYFGRNCSLFSQYLKADILWSTVFLYLSAILKGRFEDMCTGGICLMSLKPSSYKTNCPKEIRRLMFQFRWRFETVFFQLSAQMNAEKVLAKSFRGLFTRLQNKILGHNLCITFNGIFREACDIGKIKELIF